MGDFNLNLLNCENHKLTNEFLDIMYSNMFFPLITRPTRITSYTATLIDNIFTNNLDNCIFSGLFFTDISDHLPIFCLLYCQEQPNKPKDNSYIFFRDKNRDKVLKFRDKLENTDWAAVCEPPDPINSYAKFQCEYTNIFHSCFPLIKSKACSKRFSKPWMTNGLCISIKRKNKLYRKFRKNPSCENNTSYKDFKNKLNHSIRIAKRLYFETKLRNATMNIKKTWQILNEVTNRKKCCNKLPSMFFFKNQNISDPAEIADRFNNYFINVGPSLAKQIPISSRTATSYLCGNFVNSIFFDSVSELEIKEIVSLLRPDAAAGHDTIPMWAVKNSIDLISKPLC